MADQMVLRRIIFSIKIKTDLGGETQSGLNQKSSLGILGGYEFTDCPYYFAEDWLEPYVEELKKGDLAIFWDENKEYAKIGTYLHRGVYHYDHSNTSWTHAIKFESKEQYERLIKGEI